MASNSVTGSFRGIEVSFTYNGPHVIMSVLKKTDVGKQLRVMFQQQPLSGRVNWTSFQLSGQTQEVVVPTEVMQSHKLAFYVDDHEPIATYTDKILQELKLIHEQQVIDDKKDNPIPETETQTTQNIETDSSEKSNEIYNNNHVPDLLPNESHKESMPLPLPPSTEDHDSIEEKNELNDDTQAVHTPSSTEVLDTVDETNGDHNQTSIPESSETDTSSMDNSEMQNIHSNDEHNQGSVQTPKRKTQFIGHYLPEINNELQFKIKVPTLPKSGTKMETTFIPPRQTHSSKFKGKSYGFFGNLAGAFGLTVPKKKEYYVKQNEHLYENFHTELEKLESNYNNGCGIPLDNWDFDSLSEQQTAVLLLNMMVNEMSEWKKVAKKGNTSKNTLIESLEAIENELKQTLKQTRGIQAPAPTLFPDRKAANDQDLMDIKKDCDIYIQRFSEKLANLEQKHADKVKIPAFKKFLVDFVREKLYPNVAEFTSQNSVQSRLNWFLDLVNYEVMPIEPGKTKFSTEHHEPKEKRSSEYESDTIVEVISPGLQSKDGTRVIENAVVVVAE